LDTNVVSALRNPSRQGATFEQWLFSQDVSTCFVSALTWLELEAGVLKKLRQDPAQGRILEQWFAAVREDFWGRSLVFDEAVATASARLWLLRPRGTIDTLIAGTALAHHLTLVTRNLADFADIPGLDLINPWDHAA
jgi:predicted nucleic acid-binding protein